MNNNTSFTEPGTLRVIFYDIKCCRLDRRLRAEAVSRYIKLNNRRLTL